MPRLRAKDDEGLPLVIGVYPALFICIWIVALGSDLVGVTVIEDVLLETLTL